MENSKKIIYVTSVLKTVWRCPKCGQLLFKDKLRIPIDESHKKSLYGNSCLNDHFFALPSKYMRELTKNNPYATNIKVNYTWYFHDYFKMMDCLKNDSAAQTTILLKSNKDKRKEKALIISNHNEKISHNIDIVSYKDEEILKILAQVFWFEEKNIIVDDENYHVCWTLDNESYDDSLGPNNIIFDVTIQKGGGYYDSITSDNFELVDALMFSPFLKRYEIVKATYDKEKEEYFMDPTLFMQFVYENGNPEVGISSPNHLKLNTDELKDESLLHSFGYNVSEKDNLGFKTRQRILSDVIDLNIIKQGRIVSHLEWCMKMHKNNKNACEKWKMDIEFVKNYKANPQRFIIASH